MLDERFVILGFAINFLGSLTYLVAVLKGQAKPNRVSWFLWMLIPMIAVAAELEQGVGLRAITTLSSGFSPLVIFVASFLNKKAYWKIGRLDVFCGGLALGGVLLWQGTDDPNLAILFAILADLLAGIPTLIKAYRFPETESSWTFLGGLTNATIGILTLTLWDFAHLAFPLYLWVICLILFTLIQFKLGLRISKKI